MTRTFLLSRNRDTLHSRADAVPQPAGRRPLGADDPGLDALQGALGVLGAKWSLSVLACLTSGTQRFNELLRQIDGVSRRMLSATLRQLERDGLVLRHVYARVPARVEYELSDTGEALLRRSRRCSTGASCTRRRSPRRASASTGSALARRRAGDAAAKRPPAAGLARRRPACTGKAATAAIACTPRARSRVAPAGRSARYPAQGVDEPLERVASTSRPKPPARFERGESVHALRGAPRRVDHAVAVDGRHPRRRGDARRRLGGRRRRVRAASAAGALAARPSSRSGRGAPSAYRRCARATAARSLPRPRGPSRSRRSASASSRVDCAARAAQRSRRDPATWL